MMSCNQLVCFYTVSTFNRREEDVKGKSFFLLIFHPLKVAPIFQLCCFLFGYNHLHDEALKIRSMNWWKFYFFTSLRKIVERSEKHFYQKVLGKIVSFWSFNRASINTRNFHYFRLSLSFHRKKISKDFMFNLQSSHARKELSSTRCE